MKTKLPPELITALSEVESIADGLAATSCDFPASSFADMNITCVLNNLDDVASSVFLEDLTDAPAKLMSAARSFRNVFPSDSVGWEDAATLNNAALLIAEHLPKEFAAWPNAPRRI